MTPEALRTAARGAEFVGSFPDDPPSLGLPEVAFAGRSNVGKSSALNRLLGAKAARTSRTPGRTQMVNLFRLGTVACLADLPGYGFAKVSKDDRDRWKTMIERYLAMRSELRAVVVLIDGRLPPQSLDVAMFEALATYQIPTIAVATKVDKIVRNARVRTLKKLEGASDLPAGALVAFSSVTGEGVDDLWERLADVLS